MDDDDMRYAAQQAIFKVFDGEGEDDYCLNERFVRQKNARFVNLDDYKIESTKLPQPQQKKTVEAAKE